MADGYLNFDTKINEAGFNKGISKLSNIAQTGLGVVIGNIATSAVQKIGQLGSELVAGLNESSAAWKTFQANMQMNGKTADEISKIKGELKDFAEQTIYSASDMASTFSQLEAVGTKNTTALVKGFGGLAAAASDPTQAMKTLSQQATQMAAKPKIAWEDFKLMVEQTPAGISAVAKTMGMSTQELISNVQDGKVKTEEFFDAIAKTGTNADFTALATQYKTIGQLNTVLKALIEPEFDGLYVVPTIDTGVTVSNYKFDRYCTLLDGVTKMLYSKRYRLDIRHRREQGTTGYISVCAVPIQDYSKEIELSKDSGLTYTMDDKRNGVNHLIVAGKGELQERNVLHLYVHPDGSIKKTQYYKGLDEIAEVYENTSTETDQLESQSKDKLLELCSKKTFGMDIDRLGLEVSIGDIVGGRDYLTGMYMAKPIENIIYEVTNRIESKIYELEGENEE